MRLIRLELDAGEERLVEVCVLTEDQQVDVQKHTGADLFFGDSNGRRYRVARVEILTQDVGEISLFLRWFPSKRAGHVGRMSVLDALEYEHSCLEGDETCVCGRWACP